MAIKKYTSYKEIDRDLEILQLEREIYVEKIKLGFSTFKEDIKPMNIVKGYFGFSKSNNSPLMAKAFKFAMPFVLKFLKKKI